MARKCLPACASSLDTISMQWDLFHPTSQLNLQENLICAIDREKRAIGEMDTEIRRLERKIKSQIQPPAASASAKVILFSLSLSSAETFSSFT